MQQLGRIAATAVLDIDPFEQSTRVLETKLRSVDRALSAQEKAFKNNGKSINGLKSTYNLTGKSIEAHNLILDKQKKKYNELVAETGNLSNATVKQKTDINNAEAAMNKTVSTIEGLTGKYNALGKEIAIQESNWTKIGTGIEKVGNKMTKTGEGLSSFGNKYTLGVTAPIVAGVAASVKAAVDFESAFAGTKKTVDELVDANGNVVISYADLEQGIRDMAKELPASATEIAAVAESAGQLGIQTDNVLSFSKSMIDLSESTNMTSEEAATSLARLANITKMPQTEFNNLGSSLVELGNNFATTESEITAMSLRLAGAGSQVGMSEADILGLSAALSSVGIEAEMGGSAISKIIVQMQLASAKGQDAFKGLQEVAERNEIAWESVSAAVANGGKELTNMSNAMGLGNKGLADIYKSAEDAKASLDDFGYVANMTGEEFAKAFQEDAVGAIGSFIDGLSNATDKGTTAIEMLDNMGISEVRLRDALLRAGGASELFTDAITASNEAWNENTALTEEATIRYETTESKMRMLKNEVTDIAIEFGGPFVDALRDGLQTLKPFIENVAKMAKSFSNADPETKKMIVKTLAFTAAVGPASKVLGGFLKIGGSGLSVVGNLAKKIGILSGTSTAAASAVELASDGTLKLVNSSSLLNTSALGATTSAKGLTGALGLMNPWVLGIGAAVGIGAIAWKTWGEEVVDSNRRVHRWGFDVGKVTDENLTKVQGFAKGATGEFEIMEQGVTGNTDSMAANFEKMGQSIEDNLVSRIGLVSDMIGKMPEDVREASDKLDEEEKKRLEGHLALVKENNEKISQIRNNASQQHRKVTYEESVIIKSLAEQNATAYVESLGKSEQETKQILAAMTGNIQESSSEQAKIWLQSLGKQRNDSKTEYAKRLKDLENDLLKAEYDLESEYAKEKIALLKQSGDDATKVTEDQMSLILAKYPELAQEVMLANGTLIDSMTGAQGYAIEENKKMMKSFTDFSTTASKTAEKNAKKIDLLADHTNEFGKTWNNLVLDDKTGEVKTNATEEITKATTSQIEWSNLAFNAKDADLSTNAKLVLAEAALANGHWGTLNFMGKEALIESNTTITMIQALEDKGIWDELDFEQRKAILYSNSDETMVQVLSDLGLWDALEPEIKELNADNYEFLNKLKNTEGALEAFQGMSDPLKKILMENEEVYEKIGTSKVLLREYEALPDPLKELLANNTDTITKVDEAKARIHEYNGTKTPEKILKVLSDTYGVEVAKQAMAEVNDKDVTIRVSYEGQYVQTTSGRNLEFNEKGTNYHKGGDMVVNDQKGPIYEELVHFPGKVPFIPKGRNVLIPNAPQGTKVIPAGLTKKIPFYEKGVGIDVSDTKFIQSMSRLSQSNQADVSFSPKVTVQANTESLGNMNNQLQQLIQANQKNDRLIQLMITLISGVKNINITNSDLELAVSRAQGKSFGLDNYQRR